jgi:hypothetical protein
VIESCVFSKYVLFNIRSGISNRLTITHDDIFFTKTLNTMMKSIV